MWSTNSSSSSRSSWPTATSRSSSRPKRRWLAQKGYDPAFGARPLGRVIQEHVKRGIADELLFGKLAQGGIVKVRLEGEALAFEYAPEIRTRKKPTASAGGGTPALVE